MGVANLGEPDTLADGVCWGAENIDFSRRTARTRGGSDTLADHQAATGSVVFGHGVFSDPIHGGEYLLLATAAGVWRSQWGRQPRLIAVPEAIVGAVRMVQAFRKVILFRGADLAPWEWLGGAAGFAPIATPASGSANVQIPNGPSRRGLRPTTIQNRLAVPHDRSSLAVSDILDFTEFDPAWSDFNLTGGNDDLPTALLRYNDSTLLVFNDQSIQRLIGIDATLSTLSLEPVHESIGCVAGDTVARFGNQVLWLADTGVYSLAEVEQRREVAPIPLTDSIPLIMGRVNWSAITTAHAAVYGRRYYLAVPLDGATAPNAILPYNAQTQLWEGIHWLPTGTHCDALVQLDYRGRKHLHAVDYATGRVRMLYHGRHDYTGDTLARVSASVTTRGYSAGIRSQIRRGKVRVKTWSPTLAATLATDGVSESHAAIESRTFSRTASMLGGTNAESWVDTNINDDWNRAYREDYSGDITRPFIPGTTYDPDLEQSWPLAFALNARGTFAQLTLTSSTGTMELCSLAAEVQDADAADISTP